MEYNPSNKELFNNADSFAMEFDDAWKFLFKNEDIKLSQEEKIKSTFERIKDHPFIKENPEKAIDIAKFRIKLLSLK